MALISRLWRSAHPTVPKAERIRRPSAYVEHGARRRLWEFPLAGVFHFEADLDLAYRGIVTLSLSKRDGSRKGYFGSRTASFDGSTEPSA
jgi:hypothetical protein